MTLIPITAILSIFVATPAIVFSFIYHLNKNRDEVKKLQLQKEILELEIEKEKVHLLKIEAESKQYDRLINS
ncbi:MAG: hypothetical protein LBB43_02030 [Spirochaetaceae bacterium]|jgi:hypothetical protein|nr:hypothetical protein [Spirochaetaceae bacterium]